ncbi:MAG: hypothetical protein AAGC72_16865 [Planctomycetota bacterium]
MIDLRDYKTVDPTNVPGVEPGVVAIPAESALTITDAKREVEVIRDDTNRWIEWRNLDIAKEEDKIAFVEGFFASGLTAIGETAGTWAGPFAPLATLLIGYATKRRKDRTPDEVAKEKEDSYNAGIQVGKTLVDAVANKPAS